MQSKKVEKMFMVHCVDAAQRTSTGSRLAVGSDALHETVSEFIPDLSAESKEVMRGLLEQDQQHVLDMFLAKSYRSLYSSGGKHMLQIYLISGARGI